MRKSNIAILPSFCILQRHINIPMTNTIETSISIVSLLDNEIIKIKGKPHVHIELKNMDEQYEAFLKLTKGKPTKFLTCFGENASISDQARELFSNKKRAEIKTAEALVVSQLHHKLNARFHLNFFKPDIPTKIFESEAKAIEWLEAI